MAEISNIFAKITFDTNFDLCDHSLILENAVYEPCRFNGLIFRIFNPKDSFVIFRTGKVIATGIKTEKDLNESTAKLYKVLNAINYPKVEIPNYTASLDFGKSVYIDQFYKRYQKLCILEKELFPALKLQLSFPKLTVLIFYTGKIIFTGTKNLKVLEKSVKQVLFMLSDFAVKL